MNRYVYIVITAVLLTAGCKSTQETGRYAKAQWVGQSVSAFFSQHGPASSETTLPDGSTLYEWRGGEKTVLLSSGGTTTPAPQKIVENRTIRDRDGSGQYWTRTVRSEILVPQEPVRRSASYAHLACTANITADKTGRITNLSIVNDTIGEWNILSRCAEILGE